jgi:hypothetical protein
MICARRAEIEIGETSIEKAHVVLLLDKLDETLNIIWTKQTGLLTDPDILSISWTLTSGCIPLELQRGSNFLSFAVMVDLLRYIQQKIDGVSSRLSDDEGRPLLIYTLTQSLQPIPQRSWPPIDMVKILLDEGADPNDHFNHKTVLSYALDAVDAAAELQFEKFVDLDINQKTALSSVLDTASESRSEKFADPNMMVKWGDVIELLLQFDVEPSPSEIKCINEFLTILDPVRAIKFKKFLEKEKQNNHSQHDHETTPEAFTSAERFLTSTTHTSAAHTKSQLQARLGFWKQIGGKLFRL